MTLVRFFLQIKHLVAVEHPGCVAVDFEFGKDGIMLNFRSR